MSVVAPDHQLLRRDSGYIASQRGISGGANVNAGPTRWQSPAQGFSQVEDLGEPIPFSLNPRHSYMVKDEGVKNRIYAETLAKHALELEEDAQEFQEPFYKDTEVPGSLSEDEDHSRTHHLPVHQRSHVLRTASMAPCGSYGSFQGSVGKQLGMDVSGPWAHASDPYLGYPERTRGADPHMLHEETIGDREFPSLELTHDMLKQENAVSPTAAYTKTICSHVLECVCYSSWKYFSCD
uniref:Uncharacterized protein n=1 Tax=Buteo japonicus TaxID=224669 RepID=A0A8B9Z4G6_9AVES